MAARRATLGGCSKRGGDFYLAIRGDTDLATRGELITATDISLGATSNGLGDLFGRQPRLPAGQILLVQDAHDRRLGDDGLPRPRQLDLQLLAGILAAPNQRLFDCTTYLEPTPEGSDVPYIAVPGRASFEAGHIPGADFLDLQGEFSDETTPLRFMMPSVAQLEAAFGRHGVILGSDSLTVPGDREAASCSLEL